MFRMSKFYILMALVNQTPVYLYSGTDFYVSCIMRQPAYAYAKTGADQLCSDRAGDQRLCFSYIHSAIPLLPESDILASIHLFLYSPVCVRSGRKPHRQVFS